MRTRTVQRGLLITSAFVGLALIWIGARFLLAPEAAERGFGLHFDEVGNYAFHHIKGIRDLFTGLIIIALAALGQRQALALVLGIGAIIPLTDMLIVLTTPNAIRGAAWIHGATVVIVLALAALLRGTRERAHPQVATSDEQYASVLQGTNAPTPHTAGNKHG